MNRAAILSLNSVLFVLCCFLAARVVAAVAGEWLAPAATTRAARKQHRRVNTNQLVHHTWGLPHTRPSTGKLPRAGSSQRRCMCQRSRPRRLEARIVPPHTPQQWAASIAHSTWAGVWQRPQAR